MRTHPARRHGLIVAAVLLAAACASAPPDHGSRGTEESGPAEAPSPSGSVPPSRSRAPDLGPTSVRLTPPPGGSFLVRGRYPHVPSPCREPELPKLLARYPGTLLVERGDRGTVDLTVTLSFERYLEGIAEVPPSWPPAALEAQAIAARSYALATTGWGGEEGAPLREPICATSSCQVYQGIPVPREPIVRRWVRAVRRTAGQVLLFQGRPATTVYFSTSNGHTYGNDEVFGSAPLPYLRPVAERDDGASTTSHWRVRVPFADLTRFLRAAGEWPAGDRISAARPGKGDLVVRGGGERRTIDTGSLRDAVNLWAPCFAPHRYPGRLPLPIPSRWLRLSSTGRALVVTGRGWGHGVGMVQWGAYGKARRGLSAAEILAYYYGGLRPETYPEPGLIHVQVAAGLTRLRIEPSGLGAEMNGRPIEGGRVLIEGGDRLVVRASD